MQSQFEFRIQSHLLSYTYNFWKCRCRFARTSLIRRDGDPDLDPRDRAYDCKRSHSQTIQTRLRASKLIHLKWSTHFYSCPAVEAVAGSFTVEAGGLMELIRSTTEIEPSLEPRFESWDWPTRIHLRIRTCNTKTNHGGYWSCWIDLWEGRRTRATAVEEQAVVAAPVKLHDLSVCLLWLGFIPERSFEMLWWSWRSKTSPY